MPIETIEFAISNLTSARIHSSASDPRTISESNPIEELFLVKRWYHPRIAPDRFFNFDNPPLLQCWISEALVGGELYNVS